jgi:hypothetical protein
MKQMQQADFDASEVRNIVDATFKRWQAGDRAMVPDTNDAGEALKRIEEIVQRELEETLIFTNETYKVTMKHFEPSQGVVHLAVRRIDGAPCVSWEDIQEIKNQIVGYEIEAVELFPAESRRVNCPDAQRHVWCIMKPGFQFPFGFAGGKGKEPKYKKRY